jgi:hypothetical protein
MSKVYFQASSVLASYNLDLPKTLSSEIDVYVDIEYPLLYALYLYERLRGRFEGLKAIPLYIKRFNIIKIANVIYLNSTNADLVKRLKSSVSLL